MSEAIRFDWDRANVSHIARHSVAPEEAEQALLNDPFDLAYEAVRGEERWTSLGHTADFRVLLVVWTVRGEDAIRVVTARQANRVERAAYLRKKGFGI